MLSEQGKLLIRLANGINQERGHFEAALKAGVTPSEVIDHLAFAPKTGGPSDAVADNILANKDEAAKYLAGLLGLC